MNMTLVDETALADAMENRTRAILTMSDLLDGDMIDKAGAMIAAATVLIEREAGGNTTIAASVLTMLTSPTLAKWQGAPH